MAEEVLVKESISREMISAGQRLSQHLIDSGLPVDGLLWLYDPESNTWRFVVASPEVKSSGPKSVYQRLRPIVEEISQRGEEIVAWDDIFVVDSNDSLIQLLRQAITTGQAISGIRFSRNIVNGVLIEDAYIYRLV
ncbi:MAG: hypothetical protein ACREA9_06860 [Pyrinomonadaceae bacterium]